MLLNGEYLQWKSMFSYSSTGFSVCAECSDDCTKGSLKRYLDWPSCHTYMQFWWLIYSISWHGELFIYWFLNMLDTFTFFQSYSWSNKYTVYGNMLCSCFHSDARSCLTFDPCVGWSLTFSQHVIKSTTFCAAQEELNRNFPKKDGIVWALHLQLIDLQCEIDGGGVNEGDWCNHHTRLT